MKILTASQMGEVDRMSSELYQIPSLLLMENAGRAVADTLEKERPDVTRKRVMLFCGTGNNGGDGLVAARHLAARGGAPEILLFGDPSRFKEDALVNWKMVRAMDLPVRILTTGEERSSYLKETAYPDVIVDALFGTGLSKPIGEAYQGSVKWINEAAAGGTLVVSVDIPSGVYADTPVVEGIAVNAHLTVTFTALKPSQVFPPGADKAGRVVVASIGSPAALLDNPEYRLNLITPRQVRKALPPRDRESHKGVYGHVYIVAGSREKSGAALMTGLAALRSGAGLVTLLLPKSLHRDVIGKYPELMTEWLAETAEGTADASAAETALDLVSQGDTLVLGPGLTTHESTRELVRSLVRRSPVPVVLDADGINAFAGDAGSLRNDAEQPVVITPHPGEMARLLGGSIAEVQKHRLDTASTCARENRCFALLKGFQTIVATPEGNMFVNTTGNPGMATGGSGDILSGIVGRFTAGWKRRFNGADLPSLADYLSTAVYLHGLAGDIAAESLGEESLIPTDLLPHLPEAFRRVLSSRRTGQS